MQSIDLGLQLHVAQLQLQLQRGLIIGAQRRNGSQAARRRRLRGNELRR